MSSPSNPDNPDNPRWIQEYLYYHPSGVTLVALEQPLISLSLALSGEQIFHGHNDNHNNNPGNPRDNLDSPNDPVVGCVAYVLCNLDNTDIHSYDNSDKLDNPVLCVYVCLQLTPVYSWRESVRLINNNLNLVRDLYSVNSNLNVIYSFIFYVYVYFKLFNNVNNINRYSLLKSSWWY